MARLFRDTLLTLVCIAVQGLSCPDATAQSNPGTWALKAGGDRMTIGSFRDSYQSLGFNAFTLELDYSASGATSDGSFAAGYGFPVFGIGLTYNTLSDVKFRSKNGHYSDMVTAYGTIVRDLFRTKHFGFGYNIQLGLSYSSGYYDAQTNSANWFFSSPVLLYAGGGGHLKWIVSPRLDLEAGIMVKHNSSARLAYPNGGLNYWGGGLSARYRFSSSRPPRSNVFKTQAVRNLEKGWSYEIYAGGGVHACAAEWRALVKTVPRDELSTSLLRKWPMASLSFDAIYRTGGRFALGATVDGFWNSNTERLEWADRILYSEEEVEASKGYSPLSAGIGLVQEVFYRNAALYVQEGIYLYRHMGIRGEHGPLYERAGIRYYPPPLSPFFISVCIKAHKFKADYLDFTLGIRL